MKYYYTDSSGRTVQIELSVVLDDEEMYFVEKEEVHLVETSEFTSRLIDEIGLSGEELMYCVQCTYAFFDNMHDRWSLEDDFSTEDITRLQEYVNRIIDEVQEVGDETDPFFVLEPISTEQAHKILHGGI